MRPSFTKVLQTFAALFGILALLGASAGLASADHAPSEAHLDNAGGDYSCDDTEWHFIINGLDDPADAPGAISVTWSNGETETVQRDLEPSSDPVAHYTTTAYLDSEVVDATASISGNHNKFLLSHGPCEPTVSFDDASVVVECVEGAPSNIVFELSSTNIDDGTTATVNLLAGETNHGSDEVTFNSGSAAGEIAYPTGVDGELVLSITVEGVSDTAVVTEACEPVSGETPVVSPGTEVPEGPTEPEESEPEAPTAEPVTEVEGDEAVAPTEPVTPDVAPTVTPDAPAQPGVEAVADRNPEVLGSQTIRTLPRTGVSDYLAPFGLGLILLGFGLQRTSKRLSAARARS